MNVPFKTIKINKNYNLSDYYTDENSDVTGPKGAFTFIDRGELRHLACEAYGRPENGLVLKVFFSKPLRGIDFFSHDSEKQYVLESTVEGHHWATDDGVTVLEASRFQNLCSWRGNAPRIYGLVVVEWLDRTCLAQLSEDAGLMYVMEAESEETMQGAWNKIVTIANDWGHEAIYEEINDGAFWGGGKRAGGEPKWLDFQDFAPKRDGSFERILVDIILKECMHFSVPIYQNIPGLESYIAEKGVKGWRFCEKRFIDFGLDKYNFEGKTVVDFGCDNTMMLYECAKAGAMRTTGTEPENRLNTTKLAANWVGNFNGEFYGFDLKGATTQNLKERFGVDGFDVVLFLAMGNHVGHFPEYLGGMCKDLLVYEQNENGIPVNEMISGIKNLGFSTVEYRGIASDVGGRNIYVARK